MTTDRGDSRRLVLQWLVCGVGMFALVTLLGSTDAEAVEVELTIIAGDPAEVNVPVVLSLVGTPRGDGTFDFAGNLDEPDKWEAHWDFNLNPDPHYKTLDGPPFNFQGLGSNFFRTRNNDPSIARMNFSISMRALLGKPVNLNQSTFGYVRAQLNSFDAASKFESNTNGFPLFSALVDEQVEQTLFDIAPILTDAGGNVAYEEFLPRDLLNPGTNDFGIDLNYSLTPQAEASFHMSFSIVPEPSTFVLGVIGLLGLVAYATRRRGNFVVPSS